MPINLHYESPQRATRPQREPYSNKHSKYKYEFEGRE